MDEKVQKFQADFYKFLSLLGFRPRVYNHIVRRIKTIYLCFTFSDRQLYVQYVHTPHGASTCMQYTNVILLVYLGVYDQPWFNEDLRLLLEYELN